MVARLSRFARKTSSTLQEINSTSAYAPLICTSPFYAPVAQRWLGPVIYYLTDFAAAYETLDFRKVMSLDRDLVRTASLVCPNSRRLADYLVEGAGCHRDKVLVVPNATRTSSLRTRWDERTDEIPAVLRGIPRPFVSVIGNLAGNLDWELIDETMALAPHISWVFVGPFSMKIAGKAQRQARERVLAARGRAHFLGPQPYGTLHRYARACDAAVLPYRKQEPTWSGSSTRFYEHLAAGRPMLATRGVEELTHKEPLLRLVNSADELARELRHLEREGFRDGFEEERWIASQSETWDCRAQAIVQHFKTLSGRTLAVAAR